MRLDIRATKSHGQEPALQRSLDLKICAWKPWRASWKLAVASAKLYMAKRLRNLHTCHAVQTSERSIDDGLGVHDEHGGLPAIPTLWRAISWLWNH